MKTNINFGPVNKPKSSGRARRPLSFQFGAPDEVSGSAHETGYSLPSQSHQERVSHLWRKGGCILVTELPYSPNPLPGVRPQLHLLYLLIYAKGVLLNPCTRGGIIVSRSQVPSRANDSEPPCSLFLSHQYHHRLGTVAGSTEEITYTRGRWQADKISFSYPGSIYLAYPSCYDLSSETREGHQPRAGRAVQFYLPILG